ncbi:alpha/beta fold hydrolase [Actinoallomurus bryophytorum]|uniref:Pimeloyl-ACP methyl ester carboxylesterase n=1 Tax=Actinoallomurus bryophytorum TaxID=1490222 RepID=A0A543CHJ8_9ACTN|nr:alpha/beta hydrolase [Actinoallomurus bryophytorum]TQL96490.1 pimeloyl-ACP methyl ester carboxylesterase [Actinoallomurus bryophytorum]
MAGDRTPTRRTESAAKTWPGQAEYLAAYDAVLARWPVAVEPVGLRSPFGTTHVNVCGPRDGEPLVLLHGRGATSTVWFAIVGELSRTHRVYAVDLIGDAGRSVDDGRPVDGRAAFMDWLDGLFDALNLDDASLCGHSYGGWLALNFALHAPQRVRKLALLDPTDCFAGLSMSYRLRSVPIFVRPSPERMRAFITWETAGMRVDPDWLKLVCAGRRFPSAKIVLPRRPDPDRLRASKVPTLLLLAEKSRAHDIHKVSANARKLVPHVVSTVLPDVSHHSMPTEHPERLNRELGRFLD